MKNTYMVSREYDISTGPKFISAEPSTLEIHTTDSGNVKIYISTKDSPLCELADSIWKPELIFADNNPDPDTITRNKGSWIADGFRVGHEFTIANSVSNNGTYTVSAVSELVLTVDAGDSLVNETVSEGNNVTMLGSIPDTDWLLYQTVSDGLYVYEFGPTAFYLVLGTALGATVIVKS